MPKHSLHLVDLARLKQRIDADSEIPLRDLQQRDHALREAIPSAEPITQLLTWLDVLGSDAVERKRVTHSEGFLSFCLIAAGTLLGMLSMTGSLFANSERPVNLLLFLSVFVGLQITLVFITLWLTLLPGKQPGNSALSFLNPAYWAFRQGLCRLFPNLPWRQLPQLLRLLLLRWGQIFALSFNIALLLSFWLTLVVSDRNFGWSSTLNFNDATLTAVLHALSLPWQWLGQGIVTTELVSNTRFEGLQSQFPPAQIEAMRQWWPFLFFALITYGLLPRMILWLAINRRYKFQLTQALLHYPGARLVLDRLNAPLVDMHTTARQSHSTVEPGGPPNEQSIQGSVWLVEWADSLTPDRIPNWQQLGLAVSKTLTCGLAINDDEQCQAQINQHLPTTLLIAVKSWEPPLAELSDFIDAINPQVTCVLLLIPMTNKPISNSEWKDWQHFCRRQEKPMQLMRP